MHACSARDTAKLFHLLVDSGRAIRKLLRSAEHLDRLLDAEEHGHFGGAERAACEDAAWRDSVTESTQWGNDPTSAPIP